MASSVFVLTPHIQGGLGYSALRAGLTVAPTEVVFGVAGLTWRACPASWQRALIPTGFALAAVSVAAVGLALRDGHGAGFWLYAAFVGVGAVLAPGFSPTLTRALATVGPEDAADASGLLATVTQLGRLIGVTAFGTLFLDRLESLGAPEAYTSSDALLVCTFAPAATAATGAVSGLVRGVADRIGPAVAESNGRKGARPDGREWRCLRASSGRSSTSPKSR